MLRVEFDAGDAERPLRILTAFLSPNHRERLRARGIRLVEFTRYQYGDGAALIWDADGDDKIDDLNRDGRIGAQDAAILAQKLDEVQKKLGKFGGIGAVAAPKLPWMPETPYVDVDMRGVRQRW